MSQELITRANEFKTYLTLKNTWPLPRLQKPSIETYSIEYIRDLVSQAVSQNLTLQEYLASKAVTVIPAGCLPPPALEQTSCVYILIFRERPHVPPVV